mmetsp:Transcript_18912/g.40089  ORF Transcript_18912/g.40089 Transcript_18912/m.40089 type:complete len:202 (+) Transcript_18912:1897-2502(+)
MWRTRGRWSKNICSVRQRPMPPAPRRRAMAASAPVSALASTSIVFTSWTNSMNLPSLPLISGFEVGMAPRSTSPVVPLSESVSPSRIRTSPIFTSRFSSSTTIDSPTPQTQVLPQPRATTAACDVLPPRAVRMPSAANMPATSSGEVSCLIRIALMPSLRLCSTSADEKHATPTAAPGEALSPLAITAEVYSTACTLVNWL